MSNKYLKDSVRLGVASFDGPLNGIKTEQIVLVVYEDEDGRGLRVRHCPDLLPQLIIELGAKITEIGRLRQQ